MPDCFTYFKKIKGSGSRLWQTCWCVRVSVLTELSHWSLASLTCPGSVSLQKCGNSDPCELLFCDRRTHDLLCPSLQGFGGWVAYLKEKHGQMENVGRNGQTRHVSGYLVWLQWITFQKIIYITIKAFLLISVDLKDFNLLTGPLIPDVSRSCPHCDSIWETTENIAICCNYNVFPSLFIAYFIGIRISGWKLSSGLEECITTEDACVTEREAPKSYTQRIFTWMRRKCFKKYFFMKVKHDERR